MVIHEKNKFCVGARQASNPRTAAVLILLALISRQYAWPVCTPPVFYTLVHQSGWGSVSELMRFIHYLITLPHTCTCTYMGNWASHLKARIDGHRWGNETTKGTHGTWHENSYLVVLFSKCNIDTFWQMTYQWALDDTMCMHIIISVTH